MVRDITHRVNDFRDITHRYPVDNFRDAFAISHTLIRDITHQSSRYHTPITTNTEGSPFYINGLQLVGKLETHIKHKLKHTRSSLRCEPIEILANWPKGPEAAYLGFSRNKYGTDHGSV